MKCKKSPELVIYSIIGNNQISMYKDNNKANSYRSLNTLVICHNKDNTPENELLECSIWETIGKATKRYHTMIKILNKNNDEKKTY